MAGFAIPKTRTMNVLRFSDLCSQGKARGQRVFIRADLNVPQDEAAPSPKTPASAHRCPASRWRWTPVRP
jgi:hypothetical protein